MQPLLKSPAPLRCFELRRTFANTPLPLFPPAGEANNRKLEIRITNTVHCTAWYRLALYCSVPQARATTRSWRYASPWTRRSGC